MEEATAAQTTQEDAGDSVEEDGVPEVRKKHLTNSQRNQILHSLLSLSDGQHHLNHGAIAAVAKEYGFSRQAIAAVWKRGLQSVADGSGAMVVANKRSTMTIRIQQDNAKPHNSATNNSPVVQGVIDATGLNIVFDNQPAQSPDCNVLDLGYFASIQALNQRKQTRTLTELVAAVDASFVELDKKKLDNVFLTHQAVCKEILKAGGANDYKVPHLGKDRLRRQNILPLALPVEPGLIDTIRTLRPTLPELPELPAAEEEAVEEAVAV